MDSGPLVRHSNQGDHVNMPSIRDLIQNELDAGKTVRELEADSGYRVKFQTFQELSRNAPKQFPKDLKTVAGMAAALRVTETAVVLAYARGLGVDIEAPSRFAARLPPGVDSVNGDMQDAIVKLTRVAVSMSRTDGSIPVARDKGEDSSKAPANWRPTNPSVSRDENGDDRNQLAGS